MHHARVCTDRPFRAMSGALMVHGTSKQCTCLSNGRLAPILSSHIHETTYMRQAGG